MSGDGLSTHARATYAGLADELVPAGHRLPSASGAGVPEALIDQVLSYRPDLRPAFDAALDLAAGIEPAEEALDTLADQHPVEFAALTTLTSGAYFLSPEVRALLGYRGGEPRPVHDDVATYVDMLEAVVDRGPLHRTVD